ncbi:hypothetical protein AB3X91_09005 [Paraburkholderia sp. BR14263]|uniref:hypothetical protein n=1 Tax=unclassified Paraburkholderia TaxID=2615204 RepID=UPI0034CD5078
MDTYDNLQKRITAAAEERDRTQTRFKMAVGVTRDRLISSLRTESDRVRLGYLDGDKFIYQIPAVGNTHAGLVEFEVTFASKQDSDDTLTFRVPVQYGMQKDAIFATVGGAAPFQVTGGGIDSYDQLIRKIVFELQVAIVQFEKESHVPDLPA